MANFEGTVTTLNVSLSIPDEKLVPDGAAVPDGSVLTKTPTGVTWAGPTGGTDTDDQTAAEVPLTQPLSGLGGDNVQTVLESAGATISAHDSNIGILQGDVAALDSDVTALAIDVAGKAPLSHTHAVADVPGLAPWYLTAADVDANGVPLHDVGSDGMRAFVWPENDTLPGAIWDKDAGTWTKVRDLPF